MMKKKNRKERMLAFRKAYYSELNKQGVMDSERKEEVVPFERVDYTVEQVTELTRSALMKKAKEMGLEVNNKMTKADLEELIKGA